METIIPLDMGLGLDGSHVVVTGAAGQIGKVLVKAFISAGALVTALDINSSQMLLQHERLAWLQVDVTDEVGLNKAFEQARSKFGVVSVCCAAAGLDLSFIPHHHTICDMPLEQWRRTLNVNITGTFLTARCWLRGIRDHADATTPNVSLILIGSEAGTFGVTGNADYSTSKAAVQYGLVRSLAPEVVRISDRARVNAVAPGAVDTPQFRKECAADPDLAYGEYGGTTALKRSIPMEAVARACLMLASDNYSSHTTGQILPVDGGKSGSIRWKNNGAFEFVGSGSV